MRGRICADQSRLLDNVALFGEFCREQGCLTGPLPFLRYVVLTDRLVQEMTPEEVEAVFGHEVGHIKHHHLLFYFGFLIASLVVVVGVCMQPDGIEPFLAVAKELDVRFAFGYTPDEFATTLETLGRHELPAEALITLRVGLDGVSDAFAALRDPVEHGKVLVTH